MSAQNTRKMSNTIIKVTSMKLNRDNDIFGSLQTHDGGRPERPRRKQFNMSISSYPGLFVSKSGENYMVALNNLRRITLLLFALIFLQELVFIKGENTESAKERHRGDEVRDKRRHNISKLHVSSAYFSEIIKFWNPHTRLNLWFDDS